MSELTDCNHKAVMVSTRSHGRNRRAVTSPSEAANHAPPSSEAVLATPELLLMILMHLDMKTLLLCQRVNNQFLTTIENSHECQRALFLAGEELRKPFEPSMTRMNPLLQSKFRPWFDDIKIDQVSFATLELAKCRDVYLRPEASWRKMLVAQPPVSRLRTY